ncbi:hypothetical protein NUW58_g7017 [Xylaria curta]|uniref:Uncharacterized protein n=1 Tax=Xylaria curta TaxID=42375 RepID=A0ACC1NLG7_9PEZI|nr:hypothetical protein NUW58_g7017 [Xylaria curta]
MMKLALPLLLCLSSYVLSLPSPVGPRQVWTVGWWARELQQYGCRPVIFVFAKATFEPGNLKSETLADHDIVSMQGHTIGPTLSDGLKAAFGVTNVATQGIDYYGFLEGNYYPGGAPPWAIYDSALHV